MAKQQWRATYEDTLNQQEELRKKLDILITENRPVKDDTEREWLFYTYGDSFLGEDGAKKVDSFIIFPNGKRIQITDFGQLIRLLCYENSNMIPISFFEESGNQTIDIKEIWKSIRKIAFSLFPLAQHKAISMSKEREARDFGSKGGFSFGKKTTSEDS